MGGERVNKTGIEARKLTLRGANVKYGSERVKIGKWRHKLGCEKVKKLYYTCTMDRAPTEILAFHHPLLYTHVVETPVSFTQGIEELQRKGLVKAIGVSNFSITKTERLLKTAKITPALNSVECHPYFQQKRLKQYCDSKGVVY